MLGLKLNHVSKRGHWYQINVNPVTDKALQSMNSVKDIEKLSKTHTREKTH